MLYVLLEALCHLAYNYDGVLNLQALIKKEQTKIKIISCFHYTSVTLDFVIVPYTAFTYVQIYMVLQYCLAVQTDKSIHESDF